MSTQADILTTEKSAVAECLQKLASGDRRGHHPLSTYRLQFHKGFRFVDAQAIIPYLHELGISHVYSSPILKAREGSPHGYDITDHNQINPEIGSEAEFRTLVAELKSRDMGQILDTVPNHMGIGRGENPWWRDVLQNGQAAEHADFFDIDWDPLKPELHDKLLLPILGNQYGDELESGRIKVEFHPDSGLVVRYYDTSLPIDPQTIPLIFAPVFESTPAASRPSIEPLLHQLQSLPHHSETEQGRIRERQHRAPELLRKLSETIAKDAVLRELTDRALAAINGRTGEPSSFDSLHNLLEAQVYRLAHWRVSAEEINYRRFFDINELVGLRMENPKVFAATHRLLRQLVSDGSISGVRIDHCDGLLNPRQYFIRLQMLYAAAHCCGPQPLPPLAENGIELSVQRTFGDLASAGRAPLYTVVEKILEPGEDLPGEWPVHGTSGYDFANLVNGIFIRQEHERAFTDAYNRFLGHPLDIEQIIYDSKKVIMHTALSSEVNVLAHMLDEISSTDRHARDYTRKALRDAIRETIACFPVYRSYIDERGEVNERDRRYIHTAILRAKRRNSGTAAGVFHFLRDILLLQPTSESPADRSVDSEGYWKSADYDLYRRKLLFTLKFQQLTGPVMAKGLEDTACYIYNRFVSVNEVGSSPAEFGHSLDEFHRDNQTRAEKWPSSMLALSTHDTKRSEDVRARLNVLSELPKDWSGAVNRWKRNNAAKKRTLSDGRIAPDNNEEYLIYQTLIGAWPIGLNIHDEVARKQFVERIQQYMVKCLHEAKVNLSWINPDQEYVDAVTGFIADILTPASETRAGIFLSALQAFLEPVSYFGAINSLAQKALHLTAPGIPDIYQGTELWDFSLVDPDNRRPVDFNSRRQVLDSLSSSSGSKQLCAELLTNWSDGRIKMWVTNRILCLRREHPELFRESSYQPIAAIGEKAEHVIAYSRASRASSLIVVAPRFTRTLMENRIAPPLADSWGNTDLPLETSTREYQDIFSGVSFSPTDERLQLREVLAQFPVAVLRSI